MVRRRAEDSRRRNRLMLKEMSSPAARAEPWAKYPNKIPDSRSASATASAKSMNTSKNASYSADCAALMSWSRIAIGNLSDTDMDPYMLLSLMADIIARRSRRNHEPRMNSAPADDASLVKLAIAPPSNRINNYHPALPRNELETPYDSRLAHIRHDIVISARHLMLIDSRSRSALTARTEPLATDAIDIHRTDTRAKRDDSAVSLYELYNTLSRADDNPAKLNPSYSSSDRSHASPSTIVPLWTPHDSMKESSYAPSTVPRTSPDPAKTYRLLFPETKLRPGAIALLHRTVRNDHSLPLL